MKKRNNPIFKNPYSLKDTMKRTEIHPHEYDTEYFTSHGTGGYEEFKKGKLCFIMNETVKLLDIKQGMSFLDVGFGRGDIIIHLAKKGIKVCGIEYAEAGYNIAKEHLPKHSDHDIRIADARFNIPFDDNSFDRILSGDVIEHMNRNDGLKMIKEMYRVLKPNGFMLIHTSPNKLFLRYLYPIFKPLIKIISADVVDNVEDQLQDKKNDSYHIHEYNLLSFKKVIKDAGIKNADVWISKDILRSCSVRYTESFADSRLSKILKFLGNYYIFRFFIGNDLFAKIYKKDDQQ